MKKFISLLLVIISLFSLSVPVFAFETDEFNYSYADKYNILHSEIKRNTLSLKIKNVQNKNNCIVKIGEYQENAKLKSGYFIVDLNLSKLPKGTYDVEIYVGNDNKNYWTFLSREFSINNMNFNIHK